MRPLLPTPPSWLGDIKIFLRAVVGHSTMMQRSAQGDREAMLVHLLHGTWGFTREFPATVEHVLMRILHEAPTWNYLPYETMYQESRTWWNSEKAHNHLWRILAKTSFGVTDEQLDQAMPTAKFAAITKFIRQQRFLTDAILCVGAVEQIGEETSRYWDAHESFYNMCGVKPVPWIDAHLEHEGEGLTHEEWSWVIADLLHKADPAYGPAPTYTHFCNLTLEVGRQFLEAADEVMENQ